MHERQTASPEVFDRRQAMEATCDDPELLREIVGIFLEDLPRMVSELRNAVATRDKETLRRAAHTLKGSVSVLGGSALAAAAKDLEARARASDLDAWRGGLARVEEEAKRLVPVLKELLAG